MTPNKLKMVWRTIKNGHEETQSTYFPNWHRSYGWGRFPGTSSLAAQVTCSFSTGGAERNQAGQSGGSSPTTRLILGPYRPPIVNWRWAWCYWVHWISFYLIRFHVFLRLKPRTQEKSCEKCPLISGPYFVVRAVLPGVHIAVHVEHGRDIEVHVCHHLLHSGLSLERIQDLIRAKASKIIQKDVRDWSFLVCFFSFVSCFTCLTKYWQKAGAIHSLAWIPQSIQMAFFLAPVFTPIWRTD